MAVGAPDTLFTPLRRKRLQLANRIVVAPMTRISATQDGFATQGMANYYSRFARGGFALIVTEGVYTDQAYSQGYAHQPGLSDDAQARAWRPVVEAVHHEGGVIFAQLMHAGAISQFNRFQTRTIAPSAIRPKGRQLSMYRGSGEHPTPRSMTARDIAEVIAGFAGAARRARAIAGFDGVEIHGANGYLLDQFLTSATNHRTDRFGGGAAERTTLTVEVADAVRDAVGADYSIGVRISQAKVNDFEHKWSGGERDAQAIFGRLGQCDLDYLHITEFEAWRPAFDASNASLAALAKRTAPHLAVIANGKLEDPQRAKAMLDECKLDAIALGKGALANPAWPKRVVANIGIDAFDSSMLTPLAQLSAAETADRSQRPSARILVDR